MKSEQTFSMTKGSIAKTAFECATKYFGVQSSIHKNEYIFVPLTKYGILKNARLFLKHRLRICDGTQTRCSKFEYIPKLKIGTGIMVL